MTSHEQENTKHKKVGYLTNRLDIIRDRLAGYTIDKDDVPGSVVIRELVQNADDADASLVRFYFYPDRLEVYNNTSFTEPDFESIRTAFAASKQDVEGKIGAFGTGFLSVYHLTDEPKLCSKGREWTFLREAIDETTSQIEDETLFVFRWRSQETDIGKKVDGKIWTQDEINVLKENMHIIAYQLCLFLRHVMTIEVYNEETLLARLEREKTNETNTNGFCCEEWHIRLYNHDKLNVDDTWLFYRKQITDHQGIEGVTPKDQTVSLAFPHPHPNLSNHTWLQQHIPYRLYNFLPTPIKTTYPFLLNGAFFPTSDRRDILTDLNTDKGKWNKLVMQELGELFSDAVLDIRNKVATPELFYELLPLEGGQKYELDAIAQHFEQHACDKEIVYSSLDTWVKPTAIKAGPASKMTKALYELAEPYLPLLPTTAPDKLLEFLQEKLSIEKLQIKDVLSFLQAKGLPNNIPLEQAHSMLNTREKLEVLYRVLQNVSSDKDIRENYIEEITLYLAEDDTLHNYSDIFWGNEKARSLHIKGLLHFVAEPFQKFLSNFIVELNVENFLQCFDDDLSFEHKLRITSEETPSIINTRDRLHNLLLFLHNELDKITTDDMVELLLILDTEGYIHPVSSDAPIHFACDDAYQPLLQSLGIVFVDAEFAKDHAICEVYAKAGITKVTPQDVITCLQELLATGGCPLADAPNSLCKVEQLHHLFEYFYHYRNELDEEDYAELQCLPLFLTQGGKLVPVCNNGHTLKLPGNEDVAEKLAVLGLDTLVHADVMKGSTALFLGQEGLKIQQLTPFVAIRDDVIPHYNDEHLSHEDRLTLLNLVRSHWDEFDQSQQSELLPRLRQTPLVRCQDDEYYCGNVVYFASDKLDEILKPDYRHPHECYAQKGEAQLDSKWNNLFTSLGLLEHPQANDLVASVKYVVSSNMTITEKTTTIKAIYTLINNNVGDNKRYGNGEAFSPLANLAWLPVQRSEELHTPAEIYQYSDAPLVGNQVHLLEFREKTNSILRTCWNMREQPPIELVVKHLFDTVARKTKVDDRVYVELGNRWNELDAEHQDRLKTEPIVWDGKEDRTAQQVLFTYKYPEIERILDTRRGYLKHSSDFFKHIGVACGDQQEDYIAVLCEIAAEYNDNELDKKDRDIVLGIFAYIDKQERLYSNITNEEQQHLRDLPIYPTQSWRLVAIDAPDEPRLMLPAPETRYPVPAELLGNDRLLHNYLVRGGGGAFLKSLGVEELAPITAIRNSLHARYAQLDDSQKLTVLEYVRKVWQDAIASDRETLQLLLTEMKLLRDQSGQYQLGKALYFQSTELTDLLVQGYSYPHNSYNIAENQSTASDWYRFFQECGVREYASPEDLIESIKHITASNQTDKSVKAVQTIYDYINEHAKRNNHYGDSSVFCPLAEIAWLPARSRDQWYKPADLYQASFRDRIGSQAPVMRFSETNPALREHWNMRDEPPIQLVIKHLLYCVEHKPPKPVSERVYDELGRRWNEIENIPMLDQLRQGAVIWDQEHLRYWKGEHVLYEETRVQRFFGKYRGYLKNPDEKGVGVFFKSIGVNNYNEWDTHIAFLEELAKIYANHQEQLTEEDYQLLIINFDYLGNQIEPDGSHPDADELDQCAIVPGRDGMLHTPDNIVLTDPVHKELLELFQHTLYIVDDEKKPDKKLSLTDKGERFLRQVLGVEYLHKIVQRTLVNDPVDAQEDSERTEQLQKLVPAFERIECRQQERQETTEQIGDLPVADLKHIRLYACTALEVAYCLDGDWDIEPRPMPDKMYYDKDKQIIYFQKKEINEEMGSAINGSGDVASAKAKYIEKTLPLQDYQEMPVPLVAKELARLFFNGQEDTTIGELLKLSTIEDVDAYLNAYEFPTVREKGMDYPESEYGNQTPHPEAEPSLDPSDEDHVWNNADDGLIIVNDAVQSSEESQTSIADTAKLPRHSESVGTVQPTKTSHSRHSTGSTSDQVKQPSSPSRQSPPTQSIQSSSKSTGDDRVPSLYASQSPQTHPVDHQSWQPECAPHEAPHNIRDFMPTERPISGQNRTGLHQQSARTSHPVPQLNHEEQKHIGEWGEHYVIELLQDPSKEVDWRNISGDVEEGYDIRVTHRDDANTQIFIEVKSTSTNQENWFQITGRQWKMAEEQGERYHIYRVYNAGTKQVGVIRVINPYKLWQEGKLDASPVQIKL